MRSVSAAIGNSWGYGKEGAAKMTKLQKELIARIDGTAKASAGSTDIKANRRTAVTALRNLGA